MGIAWRELVLELLKEIAEYGELEKLEEEIADRAAFIHHHHASTYDTLYKAKVARYLPPYCPSMETKFKGIIGQQPKA